MTLTALLLVSFITVLSTIVSLTVFVSELIRFRRFRFLALLVGVVSLVAAFIVTQALFSFNEVYIQASEKEFYTQCFKEGLTQFECDQLYTTVRGKAPYGEK